MLRPLCWVPVLVWAATLGLNSPVHAQVHPAGHDTLTVLRLDRLFEEARTHNPAIRAARLESDALLARRAQVTALPDPTVMAAYRPFGFDAWSDVVPDVRVQQEIPYPGKLALAGRAAALEAEAARYEAEALAAEIILQIKRAYYDLYLVQQHEAHVRHFQERMKQFEEAAAVRYEVGRGTQQAVLRAQLQKNALARERLMLAERRRTHLETLARLTNRADLMRRAHEVVVERPDVAVDSASALALALAGRPEALRLEAEIRLAETQIAIARRAFHPDFMLEAGLMEMSGMNTLANRFMIGGGITIPLQTGRRRAAVEEARLRRAVVEARYEALQLEIQTRIHELVNRLREERRALDLYQNTLIPQAETTLEATLSAYTTGQADFLDLLEAERMRFDLHLENERTFVSYLHGAAELERIIGVQRLDDPNLSLSK